MWRMNSLTLLRGTNNLPLKKKVISDVLDPQIPALTKIPLLKNRN